MRQNNNRCPCISSLNVYKYIITHNYWRKRAQLLDEDVKHFTKHFTPKLKYNLGLTENSLEYEKYLNW